TLADVRAAIVLPLMAGVLALIGGLAASCFAKVFGVAFLGRPRSPEAEHAQEVPWPMTAAMLSLSAACVAIGIAPAVVLRPLGAAAQSFIPGGILPDQAFSIARAIPWVAGSVVLVAVLGGMIRRATRITSTWACGAPSLDSRMQYTSTAFSKPLRRVFANVYRPERTVEVAPVEGTYFPTAISYRSVRTTSFERMLYRPGVDAIVAAAYRLRRLQTGNIQIYLLYIFLALVALLVFTRFA
ncbi:MAG TPA: hypothetical protein VE825_13175, partial [Terriglobales bacterium]|nr:hypothetical protein [Terriglobales bacterium]